MSKKFVNAIREKGKAAAIRALRTGGVTFFGIMLAVIIGSPPSALAIYHALGKRWDFALGSAIISAAGTFGLNIKNPITPEVKK